MAPNVIVYVYFTSEKLMYRKIKSLTNILNELKETSVFIFGLVVPAIDTIMQFAPHESVF
jgi:hypothetical protein